MPNEDEEIIEEIEENEEVEDTRSDEEIKYDDEYDAAMAKLDEETDDEPEPEADPEENPGEEEEPDPKEVEDPDTPGAEQPATDSNEPGEEEVAEVPEGMVSIKWRGEDVLITEEESKNLMQKAYDYTYKTQQLSKDKKQHQADLELLEQLRGGDKEAIAKFVNTVGVDPVDLLDYEAEEVIEHGTTGQEQPDEPFISNEVSELMQEVEKDPELYTKMYDIQSTLPESVIGVMAKDPETFYAIVNEVRTGDADIVLPQVEAQLALLPDLDRALVTNNPDQFQQFYLNVKQSLIEAANQQQNTENPAPQTKQRANRNEVAITRSTRKRGQEVETDAFTSTKTYEDTLKRLQSQ